MLRLMHSWRPVCRALLISLLTISPAYAAIANAAPQIVIGEFAWRTNSKNSLSNSPQSITAAVSISNSSLSVVFKDADGNDLDLVGDGALPSMFPPCSGLAAPEIQQTAATTTIITTSTDIGFPSSENVATQEPTVHAPPETSPRYDLLRLNEILPQPESGKEWIELALPERDASVPLAGVAIRDRSNVIYTFATGTLDAEHPFIRANLSSSRLNNDGDDVTLIDPNGIIRDSLAYLDSTKGKSWSRYPDAVGEWVTTDQTPEAANAAPPQTESVETVVTPPNPTPKPSETTSDETAAPEAETETAPQNPAPPEPIATGLQKPISTKIAKSTKVKQKTKTIKLASAPIAYTPITFDMTHNDDYHGVRVELTGTVGSPSGLISGHGFILNAPDGRGLLVRIPTAKKLPVQGTSLSVTGTLLFQDSGDVYLKMTAKDSWTVESENADVKPRTVDLLAPKSEDAWSLVSVTGVVRTVRGQIVTINSDGVDVEIGIKPVVDYRAARILAGDTVKAVGLLEPGHDVPRILLRSAEDMNIVAHVQPKTASGSQSAVPKWAPIGAAGLAIAGTESVKRLRKRKKIRSLEKIVQTDLNTTI